MYASRHRSDHQKSKSASSVLSASPSRIIPFRPKDHSESLVIPPSAIHLIRGYHGSAPHAYIATPHHNDRAVHETLSPTPSPKTRTLGLNGTPNGTVHMPSHNHNHLHHHQHHHHHHHPNEEHIRLRHVDSHSMTNVRHPVHHHHHHHHYASKSTLFRSPRSSVHPHPKTKNHRSGMSSIHGISYLDLSHTPNHRNSNSMNSLSSKHRDRNKVATSPHSAFSRELISPRTIAIAPSSPSTSMTAFSISAGKDEQSPSVSPSGTIRSSSISNNLGQALGPSLQCIIGSDNGHIASIPTIPTMATIPTMRSDANHSNKMVEEQNGKLSAAEIQQIRQIQKDDALGLTLKMEQKPKLKMDRVTDRSLHSTKNHSKYVDSYTYRHRLALRRRDSHRRFHFSPHHSLKTINAPHSIHSVKSRNSVSRRPPLVMNESQYIGSGAVGGGVHSVTIPEIESLRKRNMIQHRRRSDRNGKRRRLHRDLNSKDRKRRKLRSQRLIAHRSAGVEASRTITDATGLSLKVLQNPLSNGSMDTGPTAPSAPTHSVHSDSDWITASFSDSESEANAAGDISSRSVTASVTASTMSDVASVTSVRLIASVSSIRSVTTMPTPFGGGTTFDVSMMGIQTVYIPSFAAYFGSKSRCLGHGGQGSIYKIGECSVVKSYSATYIMHYIFSLILYISIFPDFPQNVHLKMCHITDRLVFTARYSH